MTLEEEETKIEEAGTSLEPPLIVNDFEKDGLPLTERILEEEDWLDDGNDYGDTDGNDLGEEDETLMDVDEDDLLGEDLQIVEKTPYAIDAPGIKASSTMPPPKTSDGSGSGKIDTSASVSKTKTPRKASVSPLTSTSASTEKSKKASRSPSIGVSLRQRRLLTGFGSPKPTASGLGPCFSNPDELGPITSDDQQKTRGAASLKGKNSKVASGRPPKAP